MCVIITPICLIFNAFQKFYLNKATEIAFSSDIVESLERMVLQNSCGDIEIISDWSDFEIDILSGTKRMFSVHSIIVKSNYAKSTIAKKPVLIWLHGTGGTATLSLAASGVIRRLSDAYDIYAIDLPGFGRSIAPSELKSATEDDIENVMTTVLQKYLQHKNLTCVYLAGHSFGAYVAVSLVHKYPQHFSKLLLVGMAGLYPWVGKDGAMIGVISKWGIPMAVLRGIGVTGLWLFTTLCHMIGTGPTPLYWYHVQARPDNMTDYIVSKFVEANFLSIRGTRGCFRKLLDLKIPVALAYGETDSIVPSNQGIILSSLVGSTIPVYVIKDAWHMPMGIRGGLDFATLIMTAYETATVQDCSAAASFLAHLPRGSGSTGLFESDFFGSYDAECTRRNIEYFYERFLFYRRRQGSLCKLTIPYVAFIHGDSITRLSAAGLMVDQGLISDCLGAFTHHFRTEETNDSL